MTKLMRYLRPYLAFLTAAVVLLFFSAILDLTLPNMMSNIVNIGIQKSGIEEVAPRALSQQAYALLTRFMTPAGQQAAAAAYTPYSELDASAQQTADKTFPGAAAKDAMVYTGGEAGQAAADEVFGRADYAFVQFMQAIAEKNGVEIGATADNSAQFDLSRLEGLLPMMASATPQDYADAIAAAADTPATMTSAVAAALNKAFYTDLGADMAKIQNAYIAKIGLYMLALTLASAVCAVITGYCFAKLGSGIARDLRGDLYAKVTGFTNAEMDRFSTASLITRTTNDINQVQMMYTMGLRMLIMAPLTGIGGIIMALNKSSSMSWIIAVAVLVIMGVIALLFVFVMPRFKIMQKFVDRLNLVARENLTGLMVIRAFSTQGFQKKRFEKANRDLTNNTLFVGRAISLMMPVMMLVMNGMSLFIIWYGAQQIAQASLQVGDMIAFIQYSMQIVGAFLMISMMFVILPRASVSAERINEVLVSKSIVNDPETPVTLGHRAKGELAFHNVSFRFEGAEAMALTNVSFTARPGETTAFIGATGSGKTTLVNLIPRFYDVTDGSVTLDGVDVRDLAQTELRDNIGYVPQKGLLFTGDIAQNLRIGDADATDAQVKRAAEVAQAADFIEAMPEGYASAISQGGGNVSGGQRQRLAIARALVKKPPVYIFDDSFSALDFKTDAKLRAALTGYTEGATVLIVAQRVSTIMHAEQIVVLDEGRVAGIGTHRELLQNCPTYREIAESQLSKEELA